ncbi:MAG: ATP synthase F1 subunit delta [Flavobacteriaceae bacterium]|nr:ATP synthase F1 subunit delta [Flavobacteriaceae bacterium]
MTGSRAAKRYAKAVLLQTNEANNASVVFEDMQVVYNTITDSNELSEMLQSPVYSEENKEEALLEIFSKQSETTKSLIKILVENKRTSILGRVAASFIEIYKESEGIKVAYVTTAVSLSPELEAKVLAKVKELIGSDKVTIESTIDESIIGGFILRVGDLQYNASISNNLARIKREFNKSI